MSKNQNTVSVVVDSATATAVVTMVKNQIRNESVKYSAYVAANNVTTENVADHVKALRELAFPGVKADGRAEQGTPERQAKKFADKVRLGLRHTLGDSPAARQSSGKYLTGEALKAEAWEDVIKQARAEWDAAHEG